MLLKPINCSIAASDGLRKLPVIVGIWVSLESSSCWDVAGSFSYVDELSSVFEADVESDDESAVLEVESVDSELLLLTSLDEVSLLLLSLSVDVELLLLVSPSLLELVFKTSGVELIDDELSLDSLSLVSGFGLSSDFGFVSVEESEEEVSDLIEESDLLVLAVSSSLE